LGNGWRRQCNDISLEGNPAAHVTHKKVPYESSSDVSSEDS
jgi:hypothetical protein